MQKVVCMLLNCWSPDWNMEIAYSVPNLILHESPIIELYDLTFEFDANGLLVISEERLADVLREEAGLANSRVPNEYKFKEIVVIFLAHMLI